VLEKQTHVSLSHKAGTPAYMPPEQYLVGRAGSFSDVFAVGVMLYHMLSGQLPRREFEEQFEIYFDKPLAVSVQTVITKATLTSPKQRYQSVKVLAQELEQAVDIATPKSKITFDWVTIPTGKFIMGHGNNDTPIHEVYLPEYQITRTPITNEQWAAFLKNTGYQWASHNELWGNGLPRGKEKHPVVYVTWHDVMAFCQWAGVRLPTEAEWEKAARGTDGRYYPWGNQEENKDLANYGNNVKDTTPVGKYPKGASPYGCLDMAGNVWEWCSSMYKPYPYKADDGRENLTLDSERVLRGGSYFNIGWDIRPTSRFNDDFDSAVYNLVFGFRCAQ